MESSECLRATVSRFNQLCRVRVVGRFLTPIVASISLAYAQSHAVAALARASTRVLQQRVRLVEL